MKSNRLQRLAPSLTAVFLAIYASLCPPPGFAEEKPLEAQLIANATAVQSGKDLWLGVLVKLQPEWHIYWEYPGESGFATKVEWDLSELGTTSSQTLYPIPEKFLGAGDVVSYGYSGETLLMTRIPKVQPRAGASSVTVRAKARWLMCRAEECRDGRENLELTLPVGTPQGAHTELFEKYEALLPMEARPDNVKENIITSGNGYKIELEVSPPSSGQLLAEKTPQARGLEFFPLPPKGLTITVPEVTGATKKVQMGSESATVFTGKAHIKLEAKRSARSTTGPLTLSGLLVQQTLSENGTVGPLQANKFSIQLP